MVSVKKNTPGRFNVTIDGVFFSRRFGVYTVKLFRKGYERDSYIYVGKTGDNRRDYEPRSLVYRIGRHFHDRAATDRQISDWFEREGFKPEDFKVEIRYVLLSDINPDLESKDDKIRAVNALESSIIYDLNRKEEWGNKIINRASITRPHTRARKDKEMEKYDILQNYEALTDYLTRGD